MPSRRTLSFSAIFAVAVIGGLYGQRPFRQYPSMEGYDAIELPPDYKDHTEWVQARLMYPQHPNARFSRYRYYGGGLPDWRQGGTSWTQDYPRADRHFASALQRLTRIHVRVAEQPVNPDDLDDFYNWPWLIAGEMGDWRLTDAQVKTLREFHLRGGFIMMDDFWNADEYARFDESMRKVFPDRPVVDIDNADAIFHSVYDLDDRYQVPGRWALRGGGMARRAEGTVPRWMGVYDDQHRLMVAICFNNDVGDSWEWADEPIYPEKYSALGIRIGVNYVVYAMTH
jgi:hypothetical protein